MLLADSARGLIKCMSINNASFRKGRRKGNWAMCVAVSKRETVGKWARQQKTER